MPLTLAENLGLGEEDTTLESLPRWNCESLKELGDIEVKCFRATWTHSFGRPPAGIRGLHYLS